MTARRTAPALVWPGKRRRRCRAVRPLLLEEYHGPPAGDRDAGAAQCALLPNLLIRADNRLLLSSLLHGPLRRRIDAAGGIRLVYMDPPFAVGADFTMPVAPGPRGGSAIRGGRGSIGADGAGDAIRSRDARATGANRDTPGSRDAIRHGHADRDAIRAVAYSDVWPGGLTGFLDMMHERLLLLRELLSSEGSLFLHCDHRTAPHLRLLLDEVFGAERFLGDIVWHYTGGGRARRWFSRKHDRILHYAASARWTFNPDAVRVPYKPTSGYARGGITSRAGRRYLPDPRGTPVDDVWDIPMLNPLAGERNGYPTQKPETLLERIILAASNPGDLVADFFCGSGTTGVVAERLGRRWLLADNAALAVRTARNRLGAVPGAAPFVLASLEERKKEQTPPPAKPGTFFRSARLADREIAYRISDVRMSLRRAKRGISLTVEGAAVILLEDLAVNPQEEAAPERNRSPASCPDGPPPSVFPGRSVLSEGRSPDWPALLDGWSIGWAPGPDLALPGCRAAFLYNRVLWESRRERDGSIALTSPELVLPTGAGQLMVTLTDIFGNQCRFSAGSGNGA